VVSRGRDYQSGQVTTVIEANADGSCLRPVFDDAGLRTWYGGPRGAPATRGPATGRCAASGPEPVIAAREPPPDKVPSPPLFARRLRYESPRDCDNGPAARALLDDRFLIASEGG